MIEFFSETDFELEDEAKIVSWIKEVINGEDCELGEISYIFCDDAYLLNLNQQFLDHDTLTDIISFDNSLGKQIHGEIYISIERVKENATDFKVTFNEELCRVIIHGVLHFCGQNDKTDEEAKEMRAKENNALETLS